MPDRNKNYWWKSKDGKWHYHRKGSEPARGAVSTSTTKPRGGGVITSGPKPPLGGRTPAPGVDTTVTGAGPTTIDKPPPGGFPVTQGTATGEVSVKNLDKKKANYWWQDANNQWHEHKPGMGVPNPAHQPSSYQTKPPTKEQREQPVTKIGLQGNEYTTREEAGLKPGARPAGLPSAEKVKNLAGKPVGKSALSAKEGTGTKDQLRKADRRSLKNQQQVAKQYGKEKGFRGKEQYKGSWGAVTNKGRQKPSTGGVPAGVTPTKPAGGATPSLGGGLGAGGAKPGVSRKLYDDAKARLVGKKRKGYRP